MSIILLRATSRDDEHRQNLKRCTFLADFDSDRHPLVLDESITALIREVITGFIQRGRNTWPSSTAVGGVERVPDDDAGGDDDDDAGDDDDEINSCASAACITAWRVRVRDRWRLWRPAEDRP